MRFDSTWQFDSTRLEDAIVFDDEGGVQDPIRLETSIRVDIETQFPNAALPSSESR